MKKAKTWKLALLAGLIWLVVLIQQNLSSSITTLPESTAAVNEEILTPYPPVPTATEQTIVPALSPSATPFPPTPTVTPSPTPTPAPVYHEVKAGEIPGTIAEQYGISVEKLLRLNDITDPTTLQIGQRLLVPVTATPTLQPSPPPAQPQISPSPTRAPVYHTIQTGDMLIALAEEYDTTVEAIMLANDIFDPRTLQIGQKLLIPPDKGSILGVKTVIHEIKAGDTLLGLGMLYGSTLEDILVTNPDLEPTLLQVGQKIAIPLTQPKQNPAANPTAPRIKSPAAPLPGLVKQEQEMFTAVNGQRQAQGMSSYRLDEALVVVARTHAQDMVTRGYFSHVTPEGLTLDDRLTEHGLALNWTGENIQRNTQSAAQAAQYAVNWFMNSRPHRNNILHAHFDRIGVGVAEGPAGWYTFVLVFAGDN